MYMEDPALHGEVQYKAFYVYDYRMDPDFFIPTFLHPFLNKWPHETTRAGIKVIQDYLVVKSSGYKSYESYSSFYKRVTNNVWTNIQDFTERRILAPIQYLSLNTYKALSDGTRFHTCGFVNELRRDVDFQGNETLLKLADYPVIVENF